MSEFKVKVVPLYDSGDGLTARPGLALPTISADSLETAMRLAGEDAGPMVDQADPRPIALQVTVEVPVG